MEKGKRLTNDATREEWRHQLYLTFHGQGNWYDLADALEAFIDAKIKNEVDHKDG